MICKPSENQYGSDHMAIETVFSTNKGVVQQPCTRYLFSSAPWDKIRDKVRMEPTPNGAISADPSDLNQFTNQLIETVSKAIDIHVPKAKPSPYAKRWWTDELSALRKHCTVKRNGVNKASKRGCSSPELEREAKTATNAYYKALNKQKRSHWNNFLEDAANIWEAGKYFEIEAEASSGFANISALKGANGMHVYDNGDISKRLLSTFFPSLPANLPPSTDNIEYHQLPSAPLTLKEVRESIFHAKPLKGPGQDGLPALVWQELWPAGKSISPTFSSLI